MDTHEPFFALPLCPAGRMISRFTFPNPPSSSESSLSENNQKFQLSLPLNLILISVLVSLTLRPPSFLSYIDRPANGSHPSVSISLSLAGLHGTNLLARLDAMWNAINNWVKSEGLMLRWGKNQLLWCNITLHSTIAYWMIRKATHEFS